MTHNKTSVRFQPQHKLIVIARTHTAADGGQEVVPHKAMTDAIVNIVLKELEPPATLGVKGFRQLAHGVKSGLGVQAGRS